MTTLAGTAITWLLSIQMELLELTGLGLDVADGAGDRAHHDGFGLDHAFTELDAREKRTCRGARGREQAVAPRHVLDPVDELRVRHAHLVGALALLFAVEDQPALHLAADAAQCGRRQHALRRATRGG